MAPTRFACRSPAQQHRRNSGLRWTGTQLDGDTAGRDIVLFAPPRAIQYGDCNRIGAIVCANLVTVAFRPAHFVRRFFGSLFAGTVNAEQLAWVEAQLTPEEWRLWQRMGRIDRVESVAVARRAALDLPTGLDDDHPWVAAALLHDIGKRDSGFGTFRRSAAQLMGSMAGRSAGAAWMESTGQLRRVGIYLNHAAVGATAIAVAGGRPEVAAWAKVHHEPAAWAGAGIPGSVARVLAAADGETVR